MALRDPREVERAVDEMRAKISHTMSDETLPEQDRRDAVMRMTGEINALEVQARELREHELEMVKSANAGVTLGGKSVDEEKTEGFRNFLRTGDFKSAAITTTPDENGGYLMPDAEVASLVDVVRSVSSIMDNSTIFNLTKPGTFEVKLPRKASKTSGGWVGETDSRPATDAPEFDRGLLKAHAWYAYPEISQDSIDAIANIEQVVLDDIVATANEVFNTSFATGDGTGQATGLFSAAAIDFYGNQKSSTANALDAQQFLDAFYALPSKYLPGAAFYANGATIAALSALTWPNMNDTPLVSYANGEPTIMGKPIRIVDDAPGVDDGAFPVAFGDLRAAYAIAVHSRVSVVRDALTNKGYVGFYATGRVGGQPWDPNALLLLKSDNA